MRKRHDILAVVLSVTLLFDYAGLLTDMDEYVELRLATLKGHFNIETVMVTLPVADKTLTIEQIAAQILENWRVGQENGRDFAI